MFINRMKLSALGMTSSITSIYFLINIAAEYGRIRLNIDFLLNQYPCQKQLTSLGELLITYIRI